MNADYDPPPNEKEALAYGLALIAGDVKWTGASDFDKAMRLVQKAVMNGKKKPRKIPKK